MVITSSVNRRLGVALTEENTGADTEGQRAGLHLCGSQAVPQHVDELQQVGLRLGRVQVLGDDLEHEVPRGLAWQLLPACVHERSWVGRRRV